MSKVSICIPTYNNVASLKRCLDSIMIQNYKNFDIIITDDSTNNAVENFINNYDFQKNQFVYHKNNINLGSPENWNEAIRKAKGEFIKLLHHDDWFTYSNSIETFVKLLENNPAATIGMVSSRNIDTDLNSIININTPTFDWIKQIELNPINLLAGNFVGSPSAIIHKNYLGIYYDKNLKWFVDTEFYCSVLKKYNNVIAVDEVDAVSIGISKSQISRECEYNVQILIYEFFYFIAKHKLTHIFTNKLILNSAKSLFLQFNITTLKQIRNFGYKGILPQDINKLFNLIIKIKLKSKLSAYINLIKNSRLH